MSKENYNLRTMNEALKILREDKNTFTCCICGKETEGYGNNPYPVNNDGECCDECNMTVVIPARLKALRERENSYVDDTNLDEAKSNLTLEEINKFLKTLPTTTDSNIRTRDNWDDAGNSKTLIVFGCNGEENYIYFNGDQLCMEGPFGIDVFNSLDELADIIKSYYAN